MGSPIDIIRAVIVAGADVSKAEFIAILRSFDRSPVSGNGFFGGIAPSMRSEGDRRIVTELGFIRAL